MKRPRSVSSGGAKTPKETEPDTQSSSVFVWTDTHLETQHRLIKLCLAGGATRVQHHPPQVKMAATASLPTKPNKDKISNLKFG